MRSSHCDRLHRPLVAMRGSFPRTRRCNAGAQAAAVSRRLPLGSGVRSSESTAVSGVAMFSRVSPSACTPRKISTMPPSHHQGCADVVTGRDAGDVAGRGRVVDQRAEVQRPGDAADGGADRVEERDAERPRLHREHLARGQVGGAGAGRGEEERHHRRRSSASSRSGPRASLRRLRAGRRTRCTSPRSSGPVRPCRTAVPSSSAPAKLLTAKAAM